MIRRTVNTTPKITISAEAGYLFIQASTDKVRIPIEQYEIFKGKLETVFGIYTGLNTEEV